MVAIETTHGRFEAETIRLAERAAKKAAKAAEKEQKIKDVKREVAYVYAESKAFRMMRNDGKNKHMYFRPMGSKSWCGVTIKANANKTDDLLTFETQEGPCTVYVYSGTFIGHVEFASGNVIAIVTKNHYDGAIDVWAVGSHEGEGHMVRVPKVTVAEFSTLEDRFPR